MFKENSLRIFFDIFILKLMISDHACDEIRFPFVTLHIETLSKQWSGLWSGGRENF